MKKGIKILTVEDSREDLKLVRDLLEKEFINYSLLNVAGKDDFIKGVNEFKPDVILSNFTSAGFDGFSLIELSKELSPLTPVIIVPGSIDKDTAVECVKKGAEDSIIKENIAELGLAVKGALENKILKRERDLEKRILKLNRTYAVIYRINKMIVNILDREKLFEEACKIAVESGKFRMAWISLVDEENKIMRPHIWNGVGFGFLEEIQKMSVHDIRLNYPVPKEILKGNYVVFNKIEDESGIILLGNGFSHGFHSLISMPLKLQNKVIGSFNICTGKLESFNNDEINLLNEVSRDISFSLESITKEKALRDSEQKLLESEELFRHSFDYAAIGVCIIGIDKKFQRINKAFEDIIGYNQDTLKNFTFSDITHPDDLSIGLSNYQKMLDGEIFSSSYEKRYIRKDKKIIWVYISISLVRNTDQQPQFFITQVIDITERKRSEYQITMLAQSLKSVNEIVSITDMDNKLLFVNESYLKTYGYEESELIGKHPGLVISPSNPATIGEEIFSSTMSGGWKGELWNIRKDGSEFPIYLSTSVINDKNGKPFGLIGVAIDISERNRIQNDLIKAKEIAESVNKLKDAFIANMSHEIRTPLNGILGMTSLLKELFEGKLRKEDEDLFEGIDHSSQRIIRTVDMILNYSRLQVGEFHIFKKKLSIPSLCENLVTEYALAAKFKSLDLKFQNNFGELVLFVDEYSINMAISNLLDNAIKFTKNGFINLTLNKENNEDVILYIEDSGIGIDDDYLEKIFEPYSQAHMGYGRAYEGIGLGLSLVKKVLALNDAKISVVSKKGKGSTFAVNFGNAVNSPEKMLNKEIIIESSPEPSRNVNIVVLIVEDDKINQLTIKKFLADGYTTIITDSSDEVFEILIKNKVDIILMDISIWGKMNGLELTKVLKASHEFSNIPVIAVTAHAFEDDKQNALEAGCDNYLVKPFSKNSLLGMISKLVDKS